jgi:SulP family sulfate permease
MQGLSGGNFLLGLIACPPGASDAVTSTMYEGFGASSRWMPIASSLVFLTVLLLGTSILSYMPSVLLCASIFLFAFQMFYDWLYANVRSFRLMDYIIVFSILLVVITFGFVEGILIGVFLTVFLFVLRYSMITAIQGKYTLDDHRSSVERSASSNLSLDTHGHEALVYTIRGFLFFGTTNQIRDSIRESISKEKYVCILLDFRRVTGIDISALKTFSHIKQVCEAEGILVIYSGATKDIEVKLQEYDVISTLSNESLIFSETDYALERMEEIILKRHADKIQHSSIHHHLKDILGCEEKAKLVFNAMEKVDILKGDALFHQGDTDSGFFMLESGTMSAMINLDNGQSKRVKKFSPGSIVGEMSNYTTGKERTASVIAEEFCTLYHVDFEKMAQLSEMKQESLAAIHELIARTLSMRIAYMNKRLMLELS